MSMFNNPTEDQLRAILAIIAVVSVIAGFFMGIVSSDVFSATIGMIITHFYQGNKVTQLKSQIETHEAEIQSLKV